MLDDAMPDTYIFKQDHHKPWLNKLLNRLEIYTFRSATKPIDRDLSFPVESIVLKSAGST